MLISSAKKELHCVFTVLNFFELYITVTYCNLFTNRMLLQRLFMPSRALYWNGNNDIDLFQKRLDALKNHNPRIRPMNKTE